MENCNSTIKITKNMKKTTLDGLLYTTNSKRYTRVTT